MALRASLGPLGERNFRNLFLARSVSLFGSSMAPIALAFAVLDDLDGSAGDLGLVLAAASIPQVVLLLVGGVWADRLPRNRLLIGTDLLMFSTQAAVAALLLAGAAELWHVVALQVVRGLAQAFFFPASTGLVPESVSPPRLQQANALLGLTANGGYMLGAAAGGALVAAVGPGYTLAFDAATFLISAVFLARLELTADARVVARNFLKELEAGWQEFTARTWLWVPVLAATVANAIQAGSFLVLGPVVAERELGGAAAWGLIAAALGAGSVAGGLLMLRVQPSRPLLVGLPAFVLLAPGLALLALGAPLPAVVAAFFLGGVGSEISGTLWDTAVQENVPRDHLSRVSAYDHVGSLAAVPIGLATIGPIADSIGIDETLWIGSALLTVTILSQLLVRDVRELRRETNQAA